MSEPTKKKDMIKPISRKHKSLANKIVKHKGNVEKALLEVYPNCSISSAQQRARTILKQFPELRNRTIELLEKQGLGEAVLNERLKDIIGSDKEGVVLEGLRVGYKLHGKLQSSTNINIDKSTKTLNVSAGMSGEQSLSVIKELKELNKDLNLVVGDQKGGIIDVKATSSDDEVL